MPYVFGDYRLDTQCYELSRAGVLIPLRPKVFQVLAYLLAHRDRVVLKEELLEHLWPGQYVGDAALHGYLMAVRKALMDSGPTPRYIRTMRGRGYRFVAPVEEHRNPPRGNAPLAMLSPTDLAEVATSPVVSAPCLPPSASSLSALPLPYLPLAAADRRQVTVLSGTLAHATALADRLGLEAFQSLAQMFHTLAQECVQRYEGIVQACGEASVLALFGVPVAQEEHAWCAVRAALELQQRLPVASAGQAGLPGEGLTVQVGIHTGWVVAGRRRDPARPSVVVGEDTMHGALCVQGLAAPGTVVVSATTWPLLRAPVHGVAVGLVALPGDTEPRMAYTVHGLEVLTTPRVWSPFVGRQRELAVFDDLLARVLVGQGQVVGLIGEPGTGKSRLLAACRQRLLAGQVTMLEGYCRSYDHLIPYGPIRDLLRHQCGLSATAPPDTVATQVTSLLRAVDLSPDEHAPYLIQLLQGPAAAGPLAQIPPEVIKERTFATLRQVHLRSSQQHPLFLVVENLHWMDPTSEAYLASLVEQLAGVSMLLLTTYRPGYHPRWMDKSYATQLTLPRLTQAESRTIVCAVLPPARQVEAVVQRIVTRAEGNPLFLEELAHAVQEQDGLAADTPVPETIQAVLAARMDRLPAAAKYLLQTAAVIGTEVPVPLLAAIAELHTVPLQDGLASLQQAEFLYETRLFPERAYTFRHALTHEVAYGSLIQERRRVLHAQVVEALEPCDTERPGEQVARLAHHALRGEVWDKALRYSRQAGARALAGSAYREAVESWEQALEALAHLPLDRPMIEQAIDLHYDLAEVLGPLEQYEQRLTHLRAAETLAEGLADQRRLGHVYRSIANTLRNMQDYEPALTYFQRALAVATALGDVALQGWANQNMGMTYFNLGDYRQAMDYLQQVLTALEGELCHQSFGVVGRPSIQTRIWMVLCLSELGNFADGVAYGNEALQIAEAVNGLWEHQVVYTRMGHLHVRQGNLRQAIVLLERTAVWGQDATIPLFYRISATLLALAYALANRTTDAVTMLEQVMRNADSPFNSVTCGEAYLLAGDVEEAHRLAQRALANTRHRKMRGEEARALWLLGEIATRRDPPDVAHATTYYQHALALAEELGMRPLQAHCHLGLGTLYATTGQREHARAALATAIALYRAMEMTFWLPQAEATLVQVA